jgi:mannose-6-phosphate isomerase-like protein (cupin superfamily)
VASKEPVVSCRALPDRADLIDEKEHRMAGYQSFSLNAVEEAQSSSGAAYREFLRRPGFSMGMYLLPAGSKDAQHPHSADEVYTVQHGRAQLEVEGETIDVGPGDVISVDRGRDHHFLNITEDLAVLVIFAPPDDPET